MQTQFDSSPWSARTRARSQTTTTTERTTGWPELRDWGRWRPEVCGARDPRRRMSGAVSWDKGAVHSSGCEPVASKLAQVGLAQTWKVEEHRQCWASVAGCEVGLACAVVVDLATNDCKLFAPTDGAVNFRWFLKGSTGLHQISIWFNSKYY